MGLSHDRIFHRQCTEWAALKYVTHLVELSHDDDSKPFVLWTIFIIDSQKSMPTTCQHSTDNVLSLCQVYQQCTDFLPSV